MNKHIETLKAMRETCINREADALKTANVLAQKTLPGYETSKETIDNAFGTAERYAARAKALIYAIAVVEAAKKWAEAHVVFDTTYANFKDQASVDAANEVLRVSRDTSEKLLALFSEEQKEAKPDGPSDS